MSAAELLDEVKKLPESERELFIDGLLAIGQTLYLHSTPANAERIRKGLADFDAGNMTARELCA
jgi:hypothetical protein